MGDLLRAHLTLQPGEALKHHQLREYVDAAAQGALTVLMRKERTPVRGGCEWGSLVVAILLGVPALVGWVLGRLVHRPATLVGQS
mgnify:FL=1